MDRVFSRPGGQLLPAEYHLPMTLLEAPERHQDLINELIAEVAEYNPDLDRDLIARAFRFAAAAHEGQQRRSGEDFIHHPYSVARICAELQLDDETIAAALLHDVVEDTENLARRRQGRVRGRDRAAGRRRHEADARLLPEPRAGPGRELPEDGPGDGRGPQGHLHQARRQAPQPPHDRVPRQAEAGAEGARGARGVRAARAPARDPPDEVGARGPCVRGAPPAQVHRDQGDGQRAARRPGGARQRGGVRPPARARQGGHPGGDLRSRQALLLHLRQDGQEGQGVQRDLRPHRDARHRRALG